MRRSPALHGALATSTALAALALGCALSPLLAVRAAVAQPARAPGSAASRSARPLTSAWEDPLAPMLRRVDDYLQTFEVDGVTMDWRYSVIPSEEIRQTVVCQLLAYVELARHDTRTRLRVEIVRHADFLIGRLSEIRANAPFDGMLAYALLGAYEITGEQRFLDAGTAVTNDLLAIPTSQCLLNGGLMAAMATAEYWALTGNAQAGQKTHDIVAQLTPYQNADGSFPHWCPGSRDIHYTAWMAMELIHIGRMTNDPLIEPFLGSMCGFLQGRIGADGRAIYQQPIPGAPSDTEYFYSRATGCSYDLDSRGWTVEPAYCGVLFDRQGAPEYQPVMTFLASIENGGTFSDLYAYWPPPSDPEYPWTTADTSVVCMSINLWVLSTEVSDRIARGVPVNLVLDDLIDTTTVAPPPPPPPAPQARALVVAPNPAPGVCRLSFSLAAPVQGSLEIYDATGRRRRLLAAGPFASGAHAPVWDGLDDAGRRLPAGIYFARLTLSGVVEMRRVTLLR